MISSSTLFEFMLVATLLALTPGPDILFVISQGVTKGAKAAIMLTCGLCSGLIVHTTAAILGVSVIFKTSELAFTALKVAGALYLFYLAYKTFKNRGEELKIDNASKDVKFNKLFVRGFLMCALNPKVALFFLALFPQFVDKSLGNITMQMVQLGSISFVCSFVVFCIIGSLVSKASTGLMQNPRILKIANTLTSFLFVLIGLKLIFSSRN